MKERAWQDDVHVHACLIYMHVHALAEGTILFNNDLEVWAHLHTGKYQAISISYSHVMSCTAIRTMGQHKPRYTSLKRSLQGHMRQNKHILTQESALKLDVFVRGGAPQFTSYKVSSVI